MFEKRMPIHAGFFDIVHGNTEIKPFPYPIPALSGVVSPFFLRQRHDDASSFSRFRLLITLKSSQAHR